MVLGGLSMDDWHTRNKSKGLCPDCGAVKENPNSYRCNKCKEYHHKYYVESREFFISMGICPKCHNEPIYGNYKSCASCREKRRETRGVQIKTPSEKRRTKEKYESRKSNGICVVCGKRKSEKDRTMCHICAKKDSARKNKSGIYEYRRDNGLCLWCERPAVEEKFYCKECLEKKRELAEHARECRDMGKHSWKKENRLIFETDWSDEE